MVRSKEAGLVLVDNSHANIVRGFRGQVNIKIQRWNKGFPSNHSGNLPQTAPWNQYCFESDTEKQPFSRVFSQVKQVPGKSPYGRIKYRVLSGCYSPNTLMFFHLPRFCGTPQGMPQSFLFMKPGAEVPGEAKLPPWQAQVSSSSGAESGPQPQWQQK
jgi:hypothetical protein